MKLGLASRGNLFDVEYIESASKPKFTHKSKRSGKTAGLLTFASANGEVVLSVYLLPAKFNEQLSGTSDAIVYNKPYLLRGDWERCYMFTDKGYMSDEAWNNIMEVYCKLARKRWGDVWSVLLLDKLGSHMQPKCITQYTFIITITNT
jgi:hypothetical protein